MRKRLSYERATSERRGQEYVFHIQILVHHTDLFYTNMYTLLSRAHDLECVPHYTNMYILNANIRTNTSFPPIHKYLPD